MQIVESFYNSARDFCTYISETEISIDAVDRLLETLMKLYVAALNLPEMEPETVDRSAEPSSVPVTVRIKGGMPSGYWEIYDPFEDEEPVCGSLYDDLSDIMADLQNGCEEYEAGRIGNAVFEWRFGLDNHWGHHAVDLIKALHGLRTK